MMDWDIQGMARRHREQLLEEARRERLVRTADLHQKLDWLSRWWQALAINWRLSKAVRADQLIVRCKPCDELPACSDLKVIAPGQAI